MRRLQGSFFSFAIHVAAAAFAIPFSPALRTKMRSRSSFELRAAVFADMLFKFHQDITLFSSGSCKCLPQFLGQNDHIAITSLFERKEDFLLYCGLARCDRDDDNIVFAVG